MKHLSLKKYVRKLSAIERYNLVINSCVRYNVDAIVEGNGDFNLKQWQQAVAAAAEANPGTRVRLKSALGFCKWVDSGIAPRVTVVEAPHWDGHSESGAEFMREPFDPLSGGPVCDIKLVPGAPSRIVIRGLHGAMDARGITHFGKEIFRALRGEPLIGAHDTITDLDIRLMHQDNVKAEQQPPVETIPVIPAKTAECLADSTNSAAADTTTKTTTKNSNTVEYLWRRARIARTVANILPKMAVFLAAQARKHEDGHVVFTIPVDFRGLRAQANSTGNLTGYIRINVKPEDSPRDIMRRINQEIRDHADCFNPGYIKILPWIPISILSKQLASKIERLLYTNTTELPSGGIVSLGHINIDELSYPGFEATGAFGIPGSVGKLNLVMHSLGGNTELVLSTPKAYNEQGQLDELVEAIQTEFR